jgi:hypothetical protein
MSGHSPGRAVTDPFGERLPVDTLPPADTVRWVPRRKAQVVCAIDGGLISRQEACDLYGISDAELFSWEKLLGDHGPRALRVTRTQHYQQAATSTGEDAQGSRPTEALSAGLPGRSDIFRLLKDPDQQSDLGKADRLFALAINGQQFVDISREEAKRLRQPRRACEVAPVGANGIPLGTAPMGA